MPNKKVQTLAIIGSLLLSSSTLLFATTLNELEQRCESAREVKLAPLREDAIKECTEQQRNTQEYCMRFYRDFGAGGKAKSGVYRPRMFNDIPECQTFYEAKDKAK